MVIIDTTFHRMPKEKTLLLQRFVAYHTYSSEHQQGVGDFTLNFLNHLRGGMRCAKIFYILTNPLPFAPLLLIAYDSIRTISHRLNISALSKHKVL